MLVETQHPFIQSKFLDNIGINVGDGNSISLWKDEWLGKPCLAMLFPTIFRVIIDKQVLLSDVLRKTTAQQWEFHFRRRLYDWGKNSLNDVYEVLDGWRVMRNEDRRDTLIWKGDQSNIFSAKSMYELSKPHIETNICIDALDLVWNNVAPHKVQCFGWLVCLGKVETAEFLLRIGILQNAEAAVCKFCGRAQESSDHFLLHSEPVLEVWTITKTLSWNTCVVEKSEPNWVEVQELIKFRVAFWVPTKKGWNGYSMEDFIFRLNSMVKSL
ncbi:hypothetical protein RHSIM_Rhsim02G0101400 [Rhododendron simsii]|uniref:Reverse transcriptase zinc-binding domain-containing protein n=1 Tax=Rhododendron simsii TaxID=118357 RepID=A0A834HCG1_RHOSS|nr:hypothetical protein RHSIM_Rhsim02G0101400 [Rhododendron simsii]